MTDRNEQVLQMAYEAFAMSRRATAPLVPHKRYRWGDSEDEHGKLIEFVHRTGLVLFGPDK